MDEQPKALAALDFFTASKVGIDVASDQLIEAVREGERDPIQMRVWINVMETILERVNKETQSNQLTAADKYPGNKFEAFGATIDVQEFGTKYDYAACGDTMWERYHSDAETAKSRLSDREAFLKALKEPLTFADPETGEMVTIRPPTKKSTTGLKVTIR